MRDVMQMIYYLLQEGGISVTQIYNNPVAPQKAKLPYITMFEVLNTDDVYADDIAQMSKVVARVDVWSNINNIYSIAKQIKNVLLSNLEFCRVELGSDMYEQDTKIYHKPIDITIMALQEREV